MKIVGGLKIKGCPFCGELPWVMGRKRIDYVDGVWAEAYGEEYWIQTKCRLGCLMGSMQSCAFGVIGGVNYKTPEAAVKAWNARAGDSTDWGKSEREELEKVIRKLGEMEDEK